MEPKHDVIVIGASSGGLDALKQIVRGLPADLPAALFIVQHVAANGPGLLPTILSRHGVLPVGHAQDGEPIRQGRVYVAPPDRHLVIDGDVVRLVRGPKENLARPAIDALFRSAAVSAGPRVVGVVLTGSLYDGTSGAAAIKRCGGKVIVQDPAEAHSPSMPLSVLEHVEVDHCLSLSAIPTTLSELARQPVRAREEESMPRELQDEVRITSQELSDADMLRYVEGIGRKSILTCPDCSGTLWEIDDPRVLRYRCHVGHAFTGETVRDSGAVELENQLWSVLRHLQESVTLVQRLAEHAQLRGKTDQDEVLQRDIRRSQELAASIRTLLQRGVEDSARGRNGRGDPAGTAE
jgi:two-component system chemotaxis response regulator CheB